MVDKYPPLAESIPYRQFLQSLGEGLVDLRDEGMLKSFWLTGPSPDISDDANLLRRSEQAAKSVVHLQTGDAIQIIYSRRPAAPPPALNYSHPAAALVMAEMREKFVNEEHWGTLVRGYFSHQYERPLKNTVRALMSGGSEPQRLNHHDLLCQQALGRFQSMQDGLTNIVGLQPMTNLETFRSLLYHVTYRDLPAPLPEPHVRLNRVIACDWQINGEKPMMGEWHLRPIVITLYPSETLPQQLACLLEQPGYLDLSIRYRSLTPFDVQADLEKEKSYYQVTTLGNFMKLAKSFFVATRNDNQDAEQQIREINAAIADSQAGNSFGTVSVVALVRDKDPIQVELRAHNYMGILNGKGIIARIETIGAAKAVMTTWPGYLLMRQHEYEANRHKIKLSGQNFWDLGMPATYWEGSPTIQSSMFPADTPTPLVCSGTSGAPFHLPTHVNNNPHFLGIGTAGSGKSTFTNAYICALLGIPNVRIVLMDSSLARSSYVFSQLIGAEYHEVGAKDSIPLCPLALLDTDNGLQWLAGWFERLLFRRKAFELDESDSKALLNGLQDVRMYKNSSPDDVKHGRGRNLLDLYAAISGGTEGRNRIRKILDEVMSYYPHILCGNPSDVGKSRVTVYQLGSLNGVPKYISTPTKELILHNIIVSFDDSPTWVIWDEFWDAVGDDTSAQWLFESLRLMRGLNCSFGGMTQSSTDITQSPHCNVLLGNMPGLLFFPDASAATPYIAESLYKMGLNPHEVSRIASAPPGQFFYRSSLGARLADARLGHMGQAICAATGHQDVTLARQILQQCGERTEFLPAWLAAHGLSVAPTSEALNGLRNGASQALYNGNGAVVHVRRHEVQP